MSELQQLDAPLDDEAVDPDYHKFITPDPVIDAALTLVPANHPVSAVCDPGAGPGGWGRRLRIRWPEAHITGVEIRNVGKPAAYDEWHTCDFRTWETARRFSLIVGNPPFGDLALAFVLKSLSLLEEGGYLIFYLPVRFLASLERLEWYCVYPPLSVRTVVPRPSHSGDGKTEKGGEYIVMVWQQGHQGRLDAWGWPLIDLGFLPWKQRTRLAQQGVLL